MSENWGGKREGAGRPRNDYETITIRVPKVFSDYISHLANKKGTTKTEILLQMIDNKRAQ